MHAVTAGITGHTVVFNLLLIYKKTNKCNFVIKFLLLIPQYEWFSDLDLLDDIVNFSSVFLSFLHFFLCRINFLRYFIKSLGLISSF